MAEPVVGGERWEGHGMGRAQAGLDRTSTNVPTAPTGLDSASVAEI